MPVSPLILGESLANRCSQVLYRCLEEVGSTKGALYLRVPDQGGFDVVSFYGWPRGTRPPVSIPADHPLLLRTHRERRTYVINDASHAPEIAAFGQGSDWPRYLVTPVYLQGDWVGLLIQRDPIRGGAFEVERDEPRTLAICGLLVEALREFHLYGSSPRHAPTSTPETPAFLKNDSAPIGPGTVPEDLPTASAIIEEVAPAPERLLPPVPTPVPAMHAPETRIPGAGPAHTERLYGFPGGKEAYSDLPWEGDRTLSGWVAPATARPERLKGMIPPEQRTFFWEIAGLLCQILSATAVTLWMEDPEEVRPILAFSPLPLSPDLQQQILAHATFHLQAVNQADLRLVTRVELPQAEPLTGALATYMPLLLNETVHGHDLLMVFRQEEHSFSISEIEVIQQLGRVLALHLQESRLHERYHHAFLSVSHRILQSSEGRMPSLRPHSLATARLVRDLALRLELSTEEVEAVSIAAILHDVGLLLLDPQLLAKHQLNEEEIKKVRTHSDLAAVFLKDLRFPFDVLRVIRHHHERWDGRGYPEGLKETAIPMGSRIIAVIDAYETMTSGKGYRKPKGFRQALEEIQREAGTQFDPTIVAVFSDLMTRKGEHP
jgi:HD-GYP domain-containing protein (c-di-GMP phosphodiesterase class II)